MIDCDLAFEKSDVEAEINSSVVSIKNPRSGRITLLSVGEMIMDDPEAHGQVDVKKTCDEESCSKKKITEEKQRKIA